uniref:Integrase catalytic domain-containing protein n=1 Tax=Fagus sylvatica TaxID=28930 RepID=A0A2N9GLC3_FAGSY
MGRRWLHRLKAVPSSLHQKLRFPNDFDIMEIKGDQVASKQCIMASHQAEPPKGLSRKGKWQHNAPKTYSNQRTRRMPTQRSAKKHMQPCEELETILTPNQCSRKARQSAPVHAEAVQKEVERLLQAGARREIHYPTWLSNTIVVKKKNGKWRTHSKGIIRLPYQPRIAKRLPSSLHWGYIATRGIEVNPDQIKAIQELKAPRTHKEVQRSTAALSRFISSHANALATLASVLNANFKRFIPIETLVAPSIAMSACRINTITIGPCWMDPYVLYLKEGILPQQKKEAEIIRRKAMRFWLSKDSKLYKRSFSGPYLLCVHPDIVEDLLYEIHEGICGSHTGGRSLAHRALTQGYWWPYMQKDVMAYVKKCEKCQSFLHSVHQPAGELQPLVSPWPFAQWGMDLVGPLPRAMGNRRWLIVATDYFTKWVEAKPLANIRDKDSIKFVWKNIITRFGIPKTIVSDNGSQFNSKPFTKYCLELGIRNVYSSPAYPQSNGQAEASNKTVLDGIKKRLEDAKRRWVEELPNVLWTFRTTPRRSTGETPFSLAYGSEAVILLEIGLPTLKTSE